jgi:hypothetical protein
VRSPWTVGSDDIAGVLPLPHDDDELHYEPNTFSRVLTELIFLN